MVDTLTRTELTKKLLKSIYRTTNNLGTYCCTEVTIGIGGNERVDYMTYDTKGIFRCYEIKSTKDDFYSNAKWSFVGHYNYFVMTGDLYEQIYQDTPGHVGVYIGDKFSAYSLKRATKQNDVDVDMLKDSLIRSLSREFRKSFNSQDVDKLMYLERQKESAQKEVFELNKKLRLLNTLKLMIRRDYSEDEIKAFVEESL